MKIVGPIVSSTIKTQPIILPKASIIDKVCTPPSKSVDPLVSWTVKSTTIIVLNLSTIETVCTTSTQSVTYMDIRVHRLEIEPDFSNEI